jgi:hypothetical protein
MVSAHCTAKTSRFLTISPIMSIPEKEIVRDFKSGDTSPAPDSDIEIGIVEEPTKNGDEALRFLKNAHDVGELTAEGEKRLVRKIDWMIMPLMWCCYCLQYLDKTLGEYYQLGQLRTDTDFCRSELRSSDGPLRRREYNHESI